MSIPPADPLVTWVLLPLLIFTLRVVDVSLGTLRLLFVARGVRLLAPLIGFVEVLVWLVAITQVMHNLTHWGYYMVFAGGFATGTYVGMLIEDRLAMGTSILRIITPGAGKEVVACLERLDCGYTRLEGSGRFEQVSVVFTIMRRRQMDMVLRALTACQPKAVYSIEDVRLASRQALGYWPRKHFRRADVVDGARKAK